MPEIRDISWGVHDARNQIGLRKTGTNADIPGVRSYTLDMNHSHNSDLLEYVPKIAQELAQSVIGNGQSLFL